MQTSWLVVVYINYEVQSYIFNWILRLDIKMKLIKILNLKATRTN